MTYGVPGYIQHAGIFALRKGKEFEQKISKPFNRRQKLAVDILKDFPNWGIFPSGRYVYHA